MACDHETWLKVACGCLTQADVGSSTLYDCSASYGPAVFVPSDPQCQGLCPQGPPAPPPAMVPALNPVTQPPADVIPGLPNLTPYDVVQPYPDITRALTPVPQSQCSLWCDLNGAIEANPVISILILAGFVVLVAKGARP